MGNTTEFLPQEFRELNPLAQVPVLEFTDSQGKVTHLTQSMAILDFLEEIVPNPSILPANPLVRARSKQVILLFIDLLIYLFSFIYVIVN